MIARAHPLILYLVAFAVFAGLAMASEPLKPKQRGLALNLAVIGLMGIWVFAVWRVTLQAFDEAAVYGFNLGPRIALLAATMLAFGGAAFYGAVALYVMFCWRTAEGLVRVAERSTVVSILETTEMFVLVAVPPIGAWLLRRRILRVAQRGQLAMQARRSQRERPA